MSAERDKAIIEACAKVCNDRFDMMRADPGNSSYNEGFEDGCMECVLAIRTLTTLPPEPVAQLPNHTSDCSVFTDRIGRCDCGLIERLRAYGVVEHGRAEEAVRERNGFQAILNASFSIVLNANDFYGYACADAQQINCTGFDALQRLAIEHGHPGINAAMSAGSGVAPIKPWITPDFQAAFASISDKEKKGLADKEFASDWPELRAKAEKAERALSALSSARSGEREKVLEEAAKVCDEEVLRYTEHRNDTISAAYIAHHECAKTLGKTIRDLKSSGER